jgi:hypothetical protein
LNFMLERLLNNMNATTEPIIDYLGIIERIPCDDDFTEMVKR